MSEEPSSEGFVMVVHSTPAGTQTYSLEVAAELTAVPVDLLLRYCREGLLGPERRDDGAVRVFGDDALYEIRRIEHFRLHHGVGLPALPVVYRLVGEIERLSEELSSLRHRSGP